MNLIYFIITSLIIFLLIALRIRFVFKAAEDWNYYAYRYHHHVAVYHKNSTKEEALSKNKVSHNESLWICLLIWKVDRDTLFDYKPDFEDIYEIYILGNE